jgi:hypothetical protein
MTAMVAALRVPKVRWGIGVLLGAGVLVNYFDRVNLSVAAPQMQHEFLLSDGQLGWLFSGLFWPYALLQIPTGMILDRFGVTSVNRLSAFLWSVASHRDRLRRRVRWHSGGARSARRRGGTELPGKLEGHGLLVPPPGTVAGDIDLRCRSEVLERDRHPPGGAGGRSVRLAVGLWYHRTAETERYVPLGMQPSGD